MENKTNFFDPGLERKPDFVECMKRIYAWYDHQVIDRVPIRFSAHNADYAVIDTNKRWKDEKSRWYDVEYQVEKAIATIEKSSFLGETFPLIWPNIGPNCFAGMLGCELVFGDVTSWALPCITDEDDPNSIVFNPDSEYLKILNELTDYALERCKGKYLVGYTDMHPGVDCAAALMGTQPLLLNTIDDPDFIKAVVNRVKPYFFSLMEEFHQKLFSHNQLSVTWMQIPSYEGMHIPSCDHAAMMSPQAFKEVALDAIIEEARHFKHNIFHVDGSGVANHLDTLLAIPEIQAYQWVQGVGADKPIMQWVPLIRRIQAAGKSAVVDLQPSELDAFMEAVRPEGIFLCVDEPTAEGQQAIINKLLKWK